jgi:hypothetical protein
MALLDEALRNFEETLGRFASEIFKNNVRAKLMERQNK